MQAQTPAEAKRFLVRFISIFGALGCLIFGGFVYVRHAVVSTYFPSDDQVVSTAALLALSALGLYFVASATLGRFSIIRRPKRSFGVFRFLLNQAELALQDNQLPEILVDSRLDLRCVVMDNDSDRSST